MVQPHRMRQFKLSNDPRFVDKLRDIVGMSIRPHTPSSVGIDSEFRALDRTQPGLPLKKGRAGTMTHDYEGIRHDDAVRRDERPRRLVIPAAAYSAIAIRSSFASSMSSRSRFPLERRLRHRRQLRRP